MAIIYSNIQNLCSGFVDKLVSINCFFCNPCYFPAMWVKTFLIKFNSSLETTMVLPVPGSHYPVW